MSSSDKTAIDSENVLVVGFDGLDYQLIQKFDCENLMQEEFGTVDNYSDTFEIKTSELWTNFYTGWNYYDTGVKGLNTSNNANLQAFLDWLPEWFTKDVPGGHAFTRVLKALFNYETWKHTEEDVKVSSSLFNEIDSSRGICVPGYNPSPMWQVNGFTDLISKGYKPSEALKFWETREFEYRKNALFDELSNFSRPFLMVHFQYPDNFQHVYGDKDTDSYNESKLKRLYNRMDHLAGEINQEAKGAGYDYIIFVSDHGLPDKKEHNKNAFYSCNRELFGDEEPRMTGFKEKIIGITGFSGFKLLFENHYPEGETSSE